MALAVELNDIVYRWRRDRPVVLDIPEFSVPVGEKLFIAGPSGSGKTTCSICWAGSPCPNGAK